jgi:short-subunit dehydrogenase
MEERMEYLHRMIDVNVKGVVSMVYAVVPIMEKQKAGGVIINIASGAGKTGYPNLAVYSATKFAVIGFTQGIGKELAEENIRVYAVCPGMTATDMTGFSGMPPEKVAKRILEAATERLGLSPGEDTEVYR